MVDRTPEEIAEGLSDPTERGCVILIAADDGSCIREYGARGRKAMVSLARAGLVEIEIRDCRVCGGDGWADGCATIRGERNAANAHDTTCVACDGSGNESVPARRFTDLGRAVADVLAKRGAR